MLIYHFETRDGLLREALATIARLATTRSSRRGTTVLRHGFQ
jgi:hypothetical protein